MDTSLILKMHAFQRGYLGLLVDDIEDERMCDQPGGMLNHPAWQIGHMAVALDRMTKLLGGESALDENWSKRFAQGSTPLADRAVYPSRAELMRVLDERREAASRALASASAELLARPNPLERLVQKLPTIGNMVPFIFNFHEGTHLGQLATWRQ